MISVLIIIIIVIISKQTSELNELMKISSKYRIAYKYNCEHIVLIGDINQTSLIKFLKEFYHPDHYMHKEVKVVIIQNKEPTQGMQNVLEKSEFSENVQYIIGSIFEDEVMDIAKVKNVSVFILTNQYRVDSQKQETFSLLATKAIHEYDPKTKIYA